MTTTDTIPVPENVLITLLGALAGDTARLAAEVWQPAGVMRMGDPYGRALMWLWHTDQGEAVRLYTDTLQKVFRLRPDAKSAVDVEAALRGLTLDLPGSGGGDGEAGLMERLHREVPSRLAG